MSYKFKNPDYSNSIVGYQLTYMGKPVTKQELLDLGFSEEDIARAMSRKPKINYDYIVKGLVMQYFYSGWHGVYVVVKANDRFAWLKRYEDLNNDEAIPKRYLKKNLSQEGYSTQHCGYSSGKGGGGEYVGKVIEI